MPSNHRTGTGDIPRIIAAMFRNIATLALTLAVLSPISAAAEAETDLEPWTIPDAAQRARDLPLLMAQVNDPQVGISESLLHRLAVALAQDGDRAVIGGEHLTGSTVLILAVDAISPAGQSRQQQAVALMIPALPKKSGDAWLLTWRTLRGAGMHPTAESIAALPLHFSACSQKLRDSFLGNGDNWAGWGSPALTALLLGWLEVPGKNHVDSYARANLLHRLYETDPAIGRARILKAIQDGDETIDIRGLLLLPVESLPQFDNLFRQALHGEIKWNAVCCAVRYGSPALLEDVRALYQSKAGRWACELANGMLRYLVTYDRVAGLLLVREALTMRNTDQTACYSNLLLEVLRHFPGNDVDQLLEDYVQDPSDDVARSAIRAISFLPNASTRLHAILDHHGAMMAEAVRKDAEVRLESAGRKPAK